jgi:hypothetical protein
MAAHLQMMKNVLVATFTFTQLVVVLLIGVSCHQTFLVECFVPISIVFQPQLSSSSSIPSHQRLVFRSTSAPISIDSNEIDKDNGETLFRKIEEAKVRFITLCESKNSLLNEIRDAMSELENRILDAEEDTATKNGDILNWMNGEWELIFTPVDITRSSPFFWAFRQAFPDVSDQIYSITDGIPSPIKEVGPAYQQIDCRYILNDISSVSGTYVSRVKVATLGGIATSMMTTRASVVGCNNNSDESQGCELRIKIETTKPEQSTILQKVFGEQYGTMINDMIPPYPSGETLEQIVPGSSEVIVWTSFCDPTLRITKNKNRPVDEFFIWKRKSFNTYDTI